MATENRQINHPVATGAALDSGAHQGLFGYDTTTGRCRFQFGALAANAKSLANFGDAPTAHKASHEYGGADALVGQNIAGLRTSDSPNFTSGVYSGVTRISSGGAATLTGLTSSGGATITGAKTALATGTTGYATLNLGGTGVAPTSPVDGDMWRVADGAFVRMGANTREVILSGPNQTEGGLKTFSGRTTHSLGATMNGGKTILAAAAAGYASLNIPARSAAVTTPAFGDVWSDGTAIVLNNSLSINAADRPAWSTAYSTFNPHGTITLAATSGVWLLTDNLYNDGTNSRGILAGSYASSFYASASDGALKYDVSATTTTAGGIVSDMATRWQVSRQGGCGFYGASAPTARPSVTGSRGGNAALASLLTQLAACGLITDSTTA